MIDMATPDRKSTVSRARSILEDASPSSVRADPFEHINSPAALHADYYRFLAERFPGLEVILGGEPAMGNAAVRLQAADSLRDPRIDGAWRMFIELHTSRAFWLDIVRVFGDALRARFPDLERRMGAAFADWRVGMRGAEGNFDVWLDCQFVMNTPWVLSSAPEAEPPSVKTPHVDKCDTILSALWYFRRSDDESKGGDLDLYRWKRPPRFLRHRKVLPRDVAEVTTVPYAANTLMAFVNSQAAVHGVSPRCASTVPRRYINFIAETRVKAFAAPQMTWLPRLLSWPQRRRLGIRTIGRS